MSDYLWDPSGEPDPDVAELEKKLAPLRGEPRSRVLPARRRRSSIWWGLLAAAVVLGVAVSLFVRERRGWDVTRLAGTVALKRLGVGDLFETDSSTSVRLHVGLIGHVDLEPRTKVRILRAKATAQRLELVRGTMHAVISAPPALFQVETPSARAVDLGCAYTLRVDDAGSGELEVTYGWVAFEEGTRRSYVPTGATCRVKKGQGLGAPFYRDASPAFVGSLMRLEDGQPALEEVLSAARPKDGLTLLALVERLPETDARRVFGRLTDLVDEPEGATYEKTRAAKEGDLHAWWPALGLGRMRWYPSKW